MTASQRSETEKMRRFKHLLDRFQKAEVFYESSASKKKKDEYRPILEQLVDELAALYCELKAAGVVKESDLPEASYAQAKLIFNGRDMG